MWPILILLIANLSLSTTLGGFRREIPAHKRQSVQYSTLVGPSFINASSHTYAHAPIGKTAHLTCIVKNLHNYTVSWVRARDIHLLTAGLTTYTSDNRFVSVNPGGGSRWVLRIHHARTSDAGTYLCQVSLSPPISISVHLLVTEATSRVYPGGDVFLREGTEVVLICEVRGCPYPAHPTWYIGEHQVKEGIVVYEGKVNDTADDRQPHPLTPSPTIPPPHPHQGGSVSVGGTPTPTPPTTTTSTTPTPIGLPIARITLRRHGASLKHTGTYICTNTCTQNINLTLHVLTGDEKTAAMHHPSSNMSLYSGPNVMQILFIVLLCSMILY